MEDITKWLVQQNLIDKLKGGDLQSGQGGMFGLPSAMAPNPMTDMPKIPGMQK
jgi:hypothetical protein